jgi:tetratricopeptide (TPR) repeat protein
MVGRRRELAQIEHLLERAAAGSGGLLAVLGAPGSGRTTLADAAAEIGRDRGFEVVRVRVTGSGLLAWAQVLHDLGDPDRLADRLLAGADPSDLDRVAQQVVAGSDRLIVIDDIDRAGPGGIELLSVVGSRVGRGSTAVLVTTGTALGLGTEVRLARLTEAELTTTLDRIPAGAGPALWLASGGLPGVARALTSLPGLGDAADPVIHLALHAPSRAEFLDLDAGLVGVLEAAAQRPGSDGDRAQVLARLGHELLGDATAGPRRRALMDEAVTLARSSRDPRTLTVVLDARLHALWDPAAASDRLAAASEIVQLARSAHDPVAERRGLFWRFVAQMELGQVAAAESTLADVARAAELADDGTAAAIVTSRHAMLAVLRGRFDQAAGLIEELGTTGRRAGLADTERLVETLRGALDSQLGEPRQGAAAVDRLLTLARRLPGHFFEATAARVLVQLGRNTEAGVELEGLLPRLLAGTGPRWLGALADLSVVAAAVGNAPAAAELYRALLPYQGQLVIWGGANTVTGPVTFYLGLLASHLDRPAAAISHLDRALAWAEENGALPDLARVLAVRAQALTARDGAGDLVQAETDRRRARSVAERLGMRALLRSLTSAAQPGAVRRHPGAVQPVPVDELGQVAGEWRLRRDGPDWLLEAGQERARLRTARGLEYLRALLAAPGQEIAALDLVAGGAGLRPTNLGPPLDQPARDAYRARLAEIERQLDAADRSGDRRLAEAVRVEREAILDELRRATGLGGRPRVMDAETERARVNVTRTLRAAVDRISAQAPRAAAHLAASLRTGRLCRYQPAPGGPLRWRV